MKGEKNDARGREDKLRKQLQQRLSLNNIHCELEVIANMNRLLQISSPAFTNIDIIRHLCKEDLLQLVHNIPFLKYHKPTPLEPRDYFKIEYENANRLLIVTGIQKEFVDSLLVSFNSKSQRLSGTGNKPSVKIVNSNPFWICIETAHHESACFLKKYLRSEKKNMDEHGNTSYKVEKRRVRIVIVKDDLFTLLIDAMTESKNELFKQNFIQPNPPSNDKRKSQELHYPFVELGKTTIIYRPLPSVYNNQQNYQEMREEEFSDGFSESTSLNSDLFDPNKMKDIIETSDQGIQSENNISANPKEEQPYVESEPYNPNSTFSSPSEEKTEEERQQSEREELQHEQSVILKSQILRCEAEEYGLELPAQDIEEVEKPHPVKKEEEQRACKGKNMHSGHPLAQSLRKEVFQSKGSHHHQAMDRSGWVQTDEGMFTVLPISLMRKCLQQFRNRGHRELIQLPNWLRSENENERNRHRFFSSLTRPRLIHRERPF